IVKLLNPNALQVLLQGVFYCGVRYFLHSLWSMSHTIISIYPFAWSWNLPNMNTQGRRQQYGVSCQGDGNDRFKGRGRMPGLSGRWLAQAGSTGGWTRRM